MAITVRKLNGYTQDSFEPVDGRNIERGFAKSGLMYFGTDTNRTAVDFYTFCCKPTVEGGSTFMGGKTLKGLKLNDVSSSFAYKGQRPQIVSDSEQAPFANGRYVTLTGGGRDYTVTIKQDGVYVDSNKTFSFPSASQPVKTCYFIAQGAGGSGGGDVNYWKWKGWGIFGVWVCYSTGGPGGGSGAFAFMRLNIPKEGITVTMPKDHYDDWSFVMTRAGSMAFHRNDSYNSDFFKVGGGEGHSDGGYNSRGGRGGSITYGSGWRIMEYLYASSGGGGGANSGDDNSSRKGSEWGAFTVDTKVIGNFDQRKINFSKKISYSGANRAGTGAASALSNGTRPPDGCELGKDGDIGAGGSGGSEYGWGAVSGFDSKYGGKGGHCRLIIGY